MTLQQKLKKNKNKPLALIVNGLRYEGIELIKLLLEQDSFVILVDDLSSSRELLGELENSEMFAMMKPEGLPDLQEQVDKLDYMFFFQKDTEDSLTNSEFLKNVNVLEDALRFALDKEAKFILVDSIFIHRQILTENLTRRITKRKKSYSVSEQQKYFEKLVSDYIDKYGLKGTILRMGKIYGPDMDFEKDDILGRMILEALTKDKIIINAEGLEEHHYIYITDAVYGILKAQFSDDSNGEVYSCKSDKETTELSIAYSLLEEDYKATELDFRDAEADVLEVDDTQSLSMIGWTPKVTLQRGLKQTADSLKDKIGVNVNEEGVVVKQDKGESESTKEDQTAKEQDTKHQDKDLSTDEKAKRTKKKKAKDEKKEKKSKGSEKSNAESIMDIFGRKYKKPVLDKTEKEKNKESRLKRVTGLSIKKDKEDPVIKIKAKKREEKFSLKGKFKFIVKVSVLFLGILLYFTAIAPSIKYTYNAYKINKEVISFDRSLRNKGGQGMDIYAQNAMENFSIQREALKVPSTVIYLTDLPYSYVSDVKNRLYNYEKIFEDIYILAQYKEEIENLNSDMHFRINTLGKTNSLQQIGGFDTSIGGRNLGEVIEDLKFRLDADKDLSPLPIHKITKDTLSKDYIYDMISSMKEKFYYINMFLGVDKNVSNLLVFTDNRKESGIGGKPIVVMRIDFSNGRIERLDTTLVNHLFEQSKVDVQEEIKNYDYTSKYLEKSNPLSTINMYEDANNVIGKAYKDVYDVDPDNYIYIGTDQLMDIIERSGDVKYNNKTITTDNFYKVWDDEDEKQDLVESIALSVLIDNDTDREKVWDYIVQEWDDDDIVIYNRDKRIVSDGGNQPEYEFKISEIGEGDQIMLTRDKYLKLSYNKLDQNISGEISLDLTRDNSTKVNEVVEVLLPGVIRVQNVSGLEEAKTTTRTLNGSDVTTIIGVLSSEDKVADIGFTIEFEIGNPEGSFDSYRFLKQAGFDDVKYRVIVDSDDSSIKVEDFIEREGVYSYSGNFESDITFDVLESE